MSPIPPIEEIDNEIASQIKVRLRTVGSALGSIASLHLLDEIKDQYPTVTNVDLLPRLIILQNSKEYFDLNGIGKKLASDTYTEALFDFGKQRRPLHEKYSTDGCAYYNKVLAPIKQPSFNSYLIGHLDLYDVKYKSLDIAYRTLTRSILSSGYATYKKPQVTEKLESELIPGINKSKENRLFFSVRKLIFADRLSYFPTCLNTVTNAIINPFQDTIFYDEDLKEKDFIIHAKYALFTGLLRSALNSLAPIIE